MNAVPGRLTLAAAALMGLVIGARMASGLFDCPVDTASGMGLAALSFALAAAQVGVGLAQPVVGALAGGHRPSRVIVAGGLLLAVATAIPALWPMPVALTLTLVVTTLAGGTVGGNGLLLGEVGRAVSAARAGVAVGVIGAGASAGQSVLRPVTEWLIHEQGWPLAPPAIAALSLAALPLAMAFRRRAASKVAQPAAAAASSHSTAVVLRQWRFWRIAASFGACGFHIGSMGAHLSGVIFP